MCTATRLALVVCAGVLWAGSAFAQTYDVTFQVDMNACIIGGQFDPATNTVTTPGSMNDWSNTEFPLTDANSDGVYTGTFPVEAGTIFYKFYATPEPPLGWEADPNREYTVTTEPNQVIPVDDFRGTCGSTEAYEIRFTADMRVAASRGAFDPDEQEVYVAGNLNGWDTSGNAAYRLTESSIETNVFNGVITVDSMVTPSTQPYKFVLRRTSDGTVTYETGPDRLFQITGNEPDANGNGFQEVVVERRFFSDIGFDQVLTAPATVTFQVDTRPAYYVLEDEGMIPTNAGAGEDETEVRGVWVNGPLMWESDEADGPGGGINDWLGWNGELEGFPEFQATDADGDSVFTLTLTYPAGALRTLVGKWGVNGSDNEANGGNDHFYVITEGSQTIQKVFGAMRQTSGLYNDDNGPNGVPVYDPYILIDNSANPPTVQAVRSGGEADGTNTAAEPGAELPSGITLGQSYPNPFSAEARIAFRLEQAQDVTLRVYDLTGRLVATVTEGFRPAGDHVVDFDARDLASGTYLYRLEADGRVVSRVMTLLK